MKKIKWVISSYLFCVFLIVLNSGFTKFNNRIIIGYL